ncbi:hypothetical protein DYB38_011103 [Aphanomyces astaci]|uniref:Uncharacterized protein n=1 Tax=Aphanomyces astaci TaxID=112090 RepID=A0A397E4Q3_APHAT|nr:hypothetical protein DYB38_011103 [Aphanomyces astaci]
MCENEHKTPAVCLSVLQASRTFAASFLPAEVIAAEWVMAGRTAAAADMGNVWLLQFQCSTGDVLTRLLFFDDSFSFFLWGFAYDWRLVGGRWCRLKGTSGASCF